MPFTYRSNVFETSSSLRGTRFEITRRGWFARRVELYQSGREREGLLEALPRVRTRRFDRQAASLQVFEEQLLERCKTAWMTPVLLMLNIVVFVSAWIAAGALAQLTSSPIALQMANIGPVTSSGQWWRLISTLFVHAYPAHLILNMWALWNIGRLTERLLGRWRFLALYLGAGVLASLATLLWDPTRTSVGASGAIFGLFGAFLACLVRPGGGLPAGTFRSHWIPTLLFVSFNLFSGAVQPQIDNAAHVGGLLAGFGLGLLLFEPLQPQRHGIGAYAGWIAATVLFLAFVGGAIGYTNQNRSALPVAQQFAAQHQWYVTSEARSIAAWQQLAARAGSGTITDEELAARVTADVLPFWESAQARLNAEVPEATGEERNYLVEVANFARLRRDWSHAVIDATRERDETKSALARKLDADSTASVARISRLAALSQASWTHGGLADLRLVRSLRTLFAHERNSCIRAPVIYGAQVATTDSPTDTPALAETAGCNAQRLWMEEDFVALDGLLTGSAEHLDDLPGRASTFDSIVRGLDRLMTFGPGTIDEHLQKLARWRRAVPNSFYPVLAEAMLFNDWAWAARGTGGVSQVSQQAWTIFAFRNEMAQASLDSANPASLRDPMSCELRMLLAHGRSAGLESIQQIFEDCMLLHPRYQGLYSDMLRSLQPRWYGSAEKVADFIRIHADAADAPDRDALYAKLYWIYANVERDDVNVFEDTFASWERVRLGFDKLRSDSPKSDLIVNAYARMACLAGNASVYKELRPELEKRRSATGWTEKTTIADCDMKLMQ